MTGWYVTSTWSGNVRTEEIVPKTWTIPESNGTWYILPTMPQVPVQVESERPKKPKIDIDRKLDDC